MQEAAEGFKNTLLQSLCFPLLGGSAAGGGGCRWMPDYVNTTQHRDDYRLQGFWTTFICGLYAHVREKRQEMCIRPYANGIQKTTIAPNGLDYNIP